MDIKVKDVVIHKLSKLYFICENKKQEKWMNMNSYYQLVDKTKFDMTYFKKQFYN